METKVFKGDERRRQRRIRAKLPIKLTYDSNKITSKTRNLSVLGACVESDVQLRLDTPLKIQLTAPASFKQGKKVASPLECEGTIVRCQPFTTPAGAQRYELNVFFTNFFDRQGESVLNKLIQYLIRQEEIIIKKEYQKYTQRMAERKRRIMLKRLAILRRRRIRALKRLAAKK